MAATSAPLERRCSSGQSSKIVEMSEAASSSSPIASATMSSPTTASSAASPSSPKASASAASTADNSTNRASVISHKSTTSGGGGGGNGSALASPVPNGATAAAAAAASNTIRASPARTAARGAVPVDTIRLDALLVGGQRRFFDVGPDEITRDVKRKIWEQWPEDWPSQPPTSSALRLLHLGHFVEDDTTLRERGLRIGAVTVVHILVRSDPQKSLSGDGDDASLKKGAPAARNRGRASREASAAAGNVDESVGGGCRCVIC